MERIAWVTDSTAELDEELLANPDVHIIPMTIFFDNEEFLDGVTITPEEFYRKLKSSQSVPKTSQPSIGKFVELYNSLQHHYDHVISVHLSGDLSGTVSSATQAAEIVSVPVTVIDTKLISYMMSVLIRRGMDLAAKGHTPEEIKEHIQEFSKKNETYVLIGSLEQLHKSGRMNTAQYYLGSLLKIKPIIELNDGKLSAKEKVRSENKATIRVIDYLKEAMSKNKIDEVYLLYGLHRDKAVEWKTIINEFTENLSIHIYPLSTAIGVHAGEDTIGISWFTE